MTLHHFTIAEIHRALHDGLGKHLKVGWRDFQFHVRALLNQTLYGNHKYQF